MHVHFMLLGTNIVVVNCGNSSCLVDIRPGMLERAVAHNIACFGRGSCSVDSVRDHSGVDRGCQRLVLESVHDVLDLACKVYCIVVGTPFPTARFVIGLRKSAVRRTPACGKGDCSRCITERRNYWPDGGGTRGCCGRDSCRRSLRLCWYCRGDRY
jgi:hypothetical protein